MRLLKSLKAAFQPGTTDSELNDELCFHVEHETELNISRGMSRDEARRQALIAFGGVQQARESVREVRWTHFFEVLAQDLRYAWRMLRKNPSFTVVAVLTLGLGIGMNTAIFSVIDAVVFRSLPVRDPENLVVLKWEARDNPTTEGMASFGDCSDDLGQDHHAACSLPLPLADAIQGQTNVFSGLAASNGLTQMDMAGNGAAKRVRPTFVSGQYFDMLGVRPAVGRMLSPADDRQEAPPVAVLSYKFWQSDFGGSLSVVGKSVRLNNHPYTIAGVAEPSFTALAMANESDLWVPLAQQKALSGHWLPIQEGMAFFGYTILGRVKPGVAVAQAEAAANVVFRNAMTHQGKPFKVEDDPHLRLMAAQKEFRGNYKGLLHPVYVLMLCVGVILLIACANVAGLLLAQAARRQREIAVRLALGAKRFRLMGQLLIESLSLSILGGALGLLMAVEGARALVALLFSNPQNPPTFAPHLDWRVLAFTMGVTLLTGVVFGMAPAYASLRVNLIPSLKAVESSTATGRRRRLNLRNLLVAAQIGLAVLVLATAGLLVRTLNNLKSLDPGFDTNNLLFFGVDPRLAGYKGPRVGHLYHELREKLAALPGVKSVTYSWAPLLGNAMFMTSFHKPGTPPDSKDQVSADKLEVGPNFFSTLHIPMQVGRDFSDTDFTALALKSSETPGTVPWPAVVNQSFAHKIFPDQNPLGKTFGDSPADDPWPAFPGYEIVGVVGDAKYNNLRRSINPTIYVPVTDGDAFFELRTSADPTLLIPTIRDTVNRVDDNLAMFHIDTEKEQIDRQLSGDRMMSQLASFFGLLAVALACMGLYGLLSYEVTQRTREIGIRMAIGAQSSNVIAMVLGQGLLLAIVGGLAGIAVWLGASRLAASRDLSEVVSNMLFGVKLGDPLTLAASAGLLTVFALAACYLPARRATRVDPLVALRYE